ncbi:MAG: type 1 glutamine amidotransferase [Endomicrobiaceae bacterium]
MRVHHLQHVPFENLGSIQTVLKKNGHTMSSSHLYKGDNLPSVNDLDLLIVMGGPMSVSDENIYPWLKAEKQFIKEAIKSGKKVLGICLGAQLIAEVLGAEVHKNKYREIGWFNVKKTEEAVQTALSDILPDSFEAFHWHGDTFEIPAGAIHIAQSEACKNQGFIFDNRILALQFHLETTTESAEALLKNCRDELDGSKYVQNEKEISSDREKFLKINSVMTSVLKIFE